MKGREKHLGKGLSSHSSLIAAIGELKMFSEEDRGSHVFVSLHPFPQGCRWLLSPLLSLPPALVQQGCPCFRTQRKQSWHWVGSSSRHWFLCQAAKDSSVSYCYGGVGSAWWLLCSGEWFWQQVKWTLHIPVSVLALTQTLGSIVDCFDTWHVGLALRWLMKHCILLSRY